MKGAMDYVSIYNFIKTFTAGRGYAPSQEEIAEYFGVSQPAVSYHLHRMAADGVLTINKRHRGIALAFSHPAIRSP
jgi:Mn-dependent DtxR family transcriptional regulator